MAQKKIEFLNFSQKKEYLEVGHEILSQRQQCELLGINRSSLYYEAVGVDEETQRMMNLIDEQYTKTPFYGSRKMVVHLRDNGYGVNRKRVQRLMDEMGLEAIAPGPNTSKRFQGHRVYPYLLKGVQITHPNQVWGVDITYIRLARGFLYLAAILDWFSRYVLGWRLSNSLESSFCVETLEESLRLGGPEIMNSDQGCQFTSEDFTGVLLREGIRISMDSRGRALDNIFNERLWRSVKYEEVYLQDYQTVSEAEEGLDRYFKFYNRERYHQSLKYRTPEAVYWENRN